MEIRLIGHVGVDSGQLLLTDPCYIDSEWSDEQFQDIRIYENKITKDTLQYLKDFPHYQEIIPKYGKTMNELNATGDWIRMPNPSAKDSFSYNACCEATLGDEGYGQLNFKMGHPGVGVAFRTAYGDGVYPVYAHYNDDGELVKVEVSFLEDNNDEL